MVKAKFNQDDDPFKEVPTLKCFMRGSERARQTLGQVVSYATAHLDQFRTHVFFILLFYDSARLMRWEHIGFIVRGSASVCPTFKQFFFEIQPCRCYGARSRPCCHSFQIYEDLTKKFLFDQLQFAADPGDSDLPDRQGSKAWRLTTHRPREEYAQALRSEREKLTTAKVQYIATVLDYSNVGDQRTVTGNYVQKSWVCKTNLKPFSTLQHYRLN